MQPSEYKPLTIGDWIVTKLILMIPLVGFVMLFVWSFSSDTHPSKKTFCQSALIILGVLLGLAILLGVLIPLVAVLAGHTAHPTH